MMFPFALASLLCPGLGQIFAGAAERGAAIMVATIVIGNLNTIFLSVYHLESNAVVPWFAKQLPRYLHDLFAVYSIVFWLWQVADA